MKEFKKENLIECINKMFDIAEYDCDFDYIQKNQKIEWEDWFHYYTRTTQKEEEYKKWLRTYLKKFTVKGRIEKEIWRLVLEYWLRTVDNESTDSLW